MTLRARRDPTRIVMLKRLRGRYEIFLQTESKDRRRYLYVRDIRYGIKARPTICRRQYHKISVIYPGGFDPPRYVTQALETLFKRPHGRQTRFARAAMAGPTVANVQAAYTPLTKKDLGP